MNISIRMIHTEADPHLVTYALSRIRFALGRLVSPLWDVRLVFSDENGPKGGVDKRATLEVTGGARVFVEAHGDDPRAVIDVAATKARKALVRHLKRQKHVTRARVTERLAG